MEILVIGFFLLIVYYLIRGCVALLNMFGGSRYRAYQSLATRYRGRYESRGVSEAPTVSFIHKGSNVRVGLAPQVLNPGAGPRTRVVARFETGIPFRMELAPAGRPAPHQPPKGTRTVPAADPAFQRGYTIQANDPAIVDELLTDSVRTAIERLRKLCLPSGILISVNPERILVQIDRNLGGQADSLLAAVHESLFVHDRLLDAVQRRAREGIQILGAGPAESETHEQPTCRVCGEPIAGAHVNCARCRTPHHADCWDFVGGCSVYGCQCKQSSGASSR